MKKNLFLLATIVLSGTMVSCSSSEDDVDLGEAKTVVNMLSESIPIRLTQEQQVFANDNNRFTLNFLKTVNDGDQSGQSFIYSPLSITYVLGMVNDAATGQTEQELEQTLGFHEGGIQAVNDYCKKLIDGLPKVDSKVTLNIANAIFVNKNNAKLKPQFEQDMQTYYNAKAEALDFTASSTLDHINGWCDEKTKGMIPKILDAVEPNMVTYLLNAIYFKGNWAQKFDANETQMEVFEHAGPEKYLFEAPMMHQKEHFPYTENDLCQAVSLPYGNGAFAMTLLLPREGKQVSDVLNTLTAETWRSNYQYMGIANVDLKLPRFESNTNLNLVEIMKSLGMPYAFDPYKAEFPNFCDADTYIGLMKQVARIKLNETGTEAAAVTVIGVDKSASAEVPVIKDVVLHANRPFLYVISEQSTGTIFFIGQYMGNQ